MTFIYRFPSELPPVVPLRLKIEVNTREHFTVLGHIAPVFAVENGWFREATPVRSFRLEELLGTKLRALYQRKKGRDLFDLGVALTDDSLDAEALIACFEKYMDHTGATVTRAQFEENFRTNWRKRSSPRTCPSFSRRMPYPGLMWKEQGASCSTG